MIQKGFLKKPVYLQFVMGILGCMPASARNLMFLLRELTRQAVDRALL